MRYEQYVKYVEYAINKIEIEQDSRGTFARVWGYGYTKRYRVDINESGVIPCASHCNCNRAGNCPHMEIVDTFYNRLLAGFRKLPAKQLDQMVAAVKNEQAAAAEPVKDAEPVCTLRPSSAAAYCVCCGGLAAAGTATGLCGWCAA